MKSVLEQKHAYLLRYQALCSVMSQATNIRYLDK